MPKTLSRGAITQKSGDAEKLFAINELQKVATSVYRAGPFRLTTSDAAFHTAWTSDVMAEGDAWGVTVHFVGHVAAGAGQIFWARNAMFFRQSGGVTTLVATTDSVSIRSDANLQISVAASGNAIRATVADNSARTVDWSVWVEARAGG